MTPMVKILCGGMQHNPNLQLPKMACGSKRRYAVAVGACSEPPMLTLE